MNNPIVVFFDRGRALDTGRFTFPVDSCFPVGWGVDGTRKDPTQDACEYEVLLLDDTSVVPDLKHINKDANQTLLVIVHNNTTINADPVDNLVLKCWGRPYVCEKFSHTLGEPVFELIKGLISVPSKATEFANMWRNANHLELYDRLAAVCQIRMIDTSCTTVNLDNLSELENEILSQLLDKFSEGYRNLGDSQQRMELIKTTAAPLAP